MRTPMLFIVAAAAVGGCDLRSDDSVSTTTPPPPTASNAAYQRVDLVSDEADRNLVNPWGITPTDDGFWIADNHSGTVSIYDGAGTAIPMSGSIALGEGITGVARNPDVASLPIDGTPARFIFAREDGVLVGWNEKTARDSRPVVRGADGASYKGVAYARGPKLGPRLYVANFGAGTVDVYNAHFERMHDAGFVDERLPAGFAPFNVQVLADGMVYVAYALPNGDGDETAGAGLGAIDKYDEAGNLIARVATAGPLNAPWGMALAPAEFGRFGGALLVGNFGDGRINAFAADGTALGPLAMPTDEPIAIEGLWGLAFGNGARAGRADVLYFTAGPGDETHGIYGRIQVDSAVY